MHTRFLSSVLLALTLAAGCGDDGGDGVPVDAETPMEDGAMPMEDGAMPTEDASVADGGTEDMGAMDLGMDTDACVATTCEAAGAECGSVDDGCGGTLDCGGDDVCVASEGANGTCDTATNTCACAPSACGAGECGVLDDGCGGTVDCGTDCSSIGSSATCNTTTNRCECTARICGASDCGSVDDGCGGSIDCGTDCSDLGANGSCNTTTSTCECTPDTCAAGSCGTPDDGCGAALDCGACTGLGESCSAAFTCEVTAPVPTAGQVIFSEVLYDPNGPLSEANAEWLELRNVTSSALNLTGCTLSDASATSNTIGSVVIPAGGYLVFARSSLMADNGLPGPVAGTFSFALSNSGGDTVTLACGGATIDEIVYDDGGSWPDASSASISRDPSATSGASSNVGANWCLGVDPYFDAGGANEHRGTPGAANPPCPPTLPGFCRTQFPETISAAPGQPTTVFGRVFAAGITDRSVATDPDTRLVAELGWGPAGSDASSAAGWTWQSAGPNTGYDGTSAGEPNNDEYQADLAVFDPGSWNYAYRFSVNGGSTFLYCNTGAPGTSPSTAYDPTLHGTLTVGPYGSDDINTIRGAADGPIDVAVDLVYVTYIKPSVSGDLAGFFAQAEPTGPAIFVAVDPSGLSVGDGVTFTASGLVTSSGLQLVTALSAGPTIVTTGFDVTALRQDVTSATDLVSAVGDYEAELLTLDATIAADFTFAGTGYLAADIDTAGVAGSPDLRLRLPASVVSSTGVRRGCAITLDGPMWRFNATAQPSGWVDSDLTLGACSAPTVTGAVPVDANTVVVTFDFPIDPASVMGSGSQFTIGGLSVTAAAVTGSQVTLTTSAQTSGTGYTVTVAGSVTDELGIGVDGSANTATFTGFAGPPVLIFSEYVEGSSNNKALEITNIGADDQALGNCEVRRYANGTTTPTATTLDAVTLAAGETHVICNGSSAPALAGSCDQTSGVLTHNGDDAYELACDGVVVDIFGEVGLDPGSAWSGDCDPPRPPASTLDRTLRRICTVVRGRTVNGTFCPATEWDELPQDTFSDIGTYTCP